MNIRHIYPKNNPLIVEHIKLLGGMDDVPKPDIVHVHGCWNYNTVKTAEQLRQKGARIVLSPHGELQPWTVAQMGPTEKAAKTILWQRRLVEHSYAVIAHGKMEAEALRDLGWNPRIETVRNAVITRSITPESMNRQTENVYRKVMDSNTWALMDTVDQAALAVILKAGITSDARWCGSAPTVTDWRKLLIYAEHENLRDVVDKGVAVLGLPAPVIDTATIDSYLPTDYIRPTKAETTDLLELVQLTRKRPVTKRQLVELDTLLRREDVADDQLRQALADKRLTKHFRRLLQALSEQTLLEEGFMPLVPLDDAQTQTLRDTITNHLRI